jgi:alpha-glucosidase
MKHLALKVFLMIATLAAIPARAGLSESLGNFRDVRTDPHGVTLTADNGIVELSVYSPTVVRVRVAQGPFAPDFSFAVVQNPQGTFASVTNQPDELDLSTGKIKVVVKKNPLRLQFLNENGQVISADDQDFGIRRQGTEITSYRKLFPDEKFLGLGEKTGPVNRRGCAYQNWNSDVPAYKVDQDPLYDSIPFFIGLHDQLAYGIFLDNSYRTFFNFGASTDDKFSSFAVADGELNYYLFGGGTVEKVIADYTWLTGRAKLPPLWSFGYQQCRWSYYPDKEVLNLARTFREKNIPADVIYLDINYMDHYKVFTFSPTDFPKPAEMVAELNKMGFHVVVIVDPGLKVEPGYFAYDEGVKNNYFVKYPNGENYVGTVWPGRSHFPDFTSGRVRAWWGRLFSHYTDNGIEGFWNDMNEPSAWGQSIPDLVEFDFEGHRTTMKQAHNVFGMQMSRAGYEGARKLMAGKRPLIITRATYSGGQRYSTVWTGDNFASDEHMLLGTRIVGSMGLSGFPFTGPDVGGFMGSPSRELITRWLSIGIYTPFLRNHSAFDTPYREPWVFGKEYEAIARGLIEQRYRLLPYIYSTAYEATQTGLPVARPLAINYSFDENIYTLDYQNEYLFGPNILVAPVVSTQNYAQVYFPSGRWYRLSTDESYTGGQAALVAAPLNDLPVFARGSAIIPMQSVTQNTSEPTDGVLYLHVYQGNQDNSFSYYEDDGLTYDFEKGSYYRRLISYQPASSEIVLGAAEGRFTSKFTKVKLVLHGFEPIDRATMNSTALATTRVSDKVQTLEFDLQNGEINIRW